MKSVMLFELIFTVLTKSVTNIFAKVLTHVLGSPAVVQYTVCSVCLFTALRQGNLEERKRCTSF